jgi:coenzyme F420-reducing hydrogenase alpha subunit
MSETQDRTYRVDLLTRVEGEGKFTLRMKDGVVTDALLQIFEAPRFFEALVQGRSPQDVIDIVSRICGICPIAYQMSACNALERAFGVVPTPPLRALRRLLYCGEWIESHALHVFLLHAPDFLGYPGAIEMAADHKAVVEQGLRMKKAGNAIVELLGGRSIHPVSARVGGFSKAPRKKAMRALREQLAPALEESVAAVRWMASLPMPSFEQDYVFVALDAGDDYPLEQGETILVSGRDPVALDDWGSAMVEHHVEHSNALSALLADGTPYLCGPQARLHHHAEHLHPLAAEVMREVGLPRTVKNPYLSIVVRGVEIVHALATAIDVIDAYVEPDAPYVEAHPRASIGCGATEAPRGLLWHRYEVGDDGLIVNARIVPPTSQNQARIEADLRGLGPSLVAMDHGAATHLCEQLIRCYDPCISCATHFLDLRIEEEGLSP